MDDQVERVIECRDRHDRTDRFAEGICRPSRTRFCQVHGDLVTAAIAERLNAQVDAVDRATGFHARIDQRFAALPDDLESQILGSFAHDIRSPPEDGDTLVHGKPAMAVAVEQLRFIQPFIDLSPVDKRYFCNRRAVEGIVNDRFHSSHTFAPSSSISTFLFSE